MIVTPKQHNWLTLVLIPGVGTTQFIRLLARFHTPEEILKAPFNELKGLVRQFSGKRFAPK